MSAIKGYIAALNHVFDLAGTDVAANKVINWKLVILKSLVFQRDQAAGMKSVPGSEKPCLSVT